MVIGLIFALNAVVLSASELRDPTKPPMITAGENVQVENKSDFLVTSIIISDISRRAVINGVIVKQGDVVGGETITDIHPSWVEVSQNGTHRKLFLIPLGFKKTVSGQAN